MHNVIRENLSHYMICIHRDMQLVKEKKRQLPVSPIYIDIDSMGFVVYRVLRRSNARIFEANSRMRKVKYKPLRCK